MTCFESWLGSPAETLLKSVKAQQKPIVLGVALTHASQTKLAKWV